MLDFSKIPDGPPIPEGYVDLVYGTAGFRGNANNPPKNLEHIAYRCGLFFASIPFLSKRFLKNFSEYLKNDNSISMGVVVTASHNPFYDNGIKLFSPSGYMLDSFWESYLTSFVNTRKPIQTELSNLYDEFNYEPINYKLTILVGWDTRPSCPALVSNLTLGIQTIFDLHGLTTSKINLVGKITSPSISYLLSSGNTDVKDDEKYISFLSDSFSSFLKKFEALGHVDFQKEPEQTEDLYFDCAFGVGGYKIVRFFDLLRRFGTLPGVCNFHKLGSDEDLNHKCGASYVYLTCNFPEFLKESSQLYQNKRFCCFDGDVDRILYYMLVNPVMTSDKEYKVLLLNGDRLLVLCLKLLWVLLRNYKGKVNVGVFQTRYANGSSVNYINELMAQYRTENPNVTLHHKFFNSGIKNAEKLSENYDISLYYETNGHGNIIFNRKTFFKDSRNNINNSNSLEYQSVTLENPNFNFKNNNFSSTGSASQDLVLSKFSETVLLDFLNLFFPGGDAILNCLVLELAFKTFNLTFHDCLNFYTELPYLHDKYTIPQQFKKYFVSSVENESVLVEPEGLQDKIDRKTKEYRMCRAFLRCSGTEPVLRIYAEGENMDVVNEVTQYIREMISDFLKSKFS